MIFAYEIFGSYGTRMNDAENISLNTFLTKVERVVDAPPGSVRHVPLRPILSAAMLVDALCGPPGIRPPLH